MSRGGIQQLGILEIAMNEMVLTGRNENRNNGLEFAGGYSSSSTNDVITMDISPECRTALYDICGNNGSQGSRKQTPQAER